MRGANLLDTLIPHPVGAVDGQGHTHPPNRPFKRTRGATLSTLLYSGHLHAGPFLDGIHSRVGVLIYDLMPLQLGGLQTSMLVPPLLASFYVVLGGLFLLLDSASADDTATAQAMQGSSLMKMALSFG